MQMYALEESHLILAREAEKKKDYTCPECSATVRLRFGEYRQPHFYHLGKSPQCRLAQKGLIHLQIQLLIKDLFEGAEMEKRFPEINRIADVATRDTVYEIQYSPMSLEEAKQRTADYTSLGLDIVWILHDDTYNKKRLRPMERFLRSSPCYYANHDAQGNGIFYDQSPENPIEITKKKPLPKRKWPSPLKLRALSWRFYHEGDLFHKALSQKISTRKSVNFLTLYKTFLYSLIER